MQNDSQLNLIREARRLAERMRGRLIHPSLPGLEICATDLGAAAECIRRLEPGSEVWKGAQRSALEAEVIELRRNMDCLEALLRNAGNFYAGWARLLSPDSAPPNYNASGSPAAAAIEQPLAAIAPRVIHG